MTGYAKEIIMSDPGSERERQFIRAWQKTIGMITVSHSYEEACAIAKEAADSVGIPTHGWDVNK